MWTGAEIGVRNERVGITRRVGSRTVLRGIEGTSDAKALEKALYSQPKCQTDKQHSVKESEFLSVTHSHETTAIKRVAHGIGHFFELLVSQRADWWRCAHRQKR